MDENELSLLAKESIFELTRDIREEYLETDFVNKLDISDKIHEFGVNTNKNHTECQLLKELEEMEKFWRKKSWWLTKSYIQHVLQLLRKYPNHHKAIIKALKISRSTYRRIKLSINEQNLIGTINWKWRKNREILRFTEKAYIEKLISLPTHPVTVRTF